MINTIYIEEAVYNHPRTKEILGRFPKAVQIPCKHYGEVFNPNAQNFRFQKKNPALILAEKFDHFVLKAPSGYGIGSTHNYYFSHMLNCIYDCRYCFLQGMFRSANLVCFVNYEDFEQAISEKIRQNEDAHFFSGYDCDSLALEPVTGFADSILDFFSRYQKSLLELRTKSVQIKSLLARDPVENCVVAFSLTPDEISRKLEYGVPSVEQRLDAMQKLQERGWKLGLRFDPVIYTESLQGQYERLFRSVFQKIKIQNVHSVSLGLFRLPKGIYKRIYCLYPDEKLFAGPLTDRKHLVSYPTDLEHELIGHISKQLLKYVPNERYFNFSVDHDAIP